ncbi:MAG: hypothetical protein H6824_13465 [Planctomycetaceae bacterium]|nr:hypothetical protein [Planctomycetaceae bacterium]
MSLPAGKYGPHAAARNAGFREGDILVSVNGRTDLLTEDDLLAYGVTECLPGQKLDTVVWRNGKRLTLKLPIQE